MGREWKRRFYARTYDITTTNDDRKVKAKIKVKIKAPLLFQVHV